MCGRYTFEHAEALRQLIESLTGETYEEFVARYNVAPTQDNAVVAPDEKGKPHLRTMRWGLVPAADSALKLRLIHVNARAEEILAKRTFKEAVQRRRCVVPADGYYEWKRPDERTKLPHLISLHDRRPFFIAGIYEAATDLRPETFALLTCGSNRLMAVIHDRMPVILDAPGLARWLQPGPIGPTDLSTICVPYVDEDMQVWPVSPFVNSASNEGPACVVPVLPYVDPQGSLGL
jgi:putative SOS response-associated peptidase YedK